MFALLCYLLCLSLPPALAQQNSAVINSITQNATAFALLYGYPLLAFQKLASPFIASDNVNKLVHIRQLATADLTAVVKPNVDTLYSVAIYDVGSQRVSLTVPEIPSSQYALLSFYDPFGDNWANIGTGNAFYQNGSYELSRRPSNGSVGVNPSTDLNTIVANVHSPTDHGILLIRWLVNNNYDEIHTLQDRTSLNASVDRTSGPYLQNISHPINESSVAGNVLQLLAQYGPYDPPQLLDQMAPVSSHLRAAGISQSPSVNQTRQYTAPSGVDLDAANRTALETAAAAAAAPSNNVPQNNGWCIPQPAVSGDFENGTNYAYRTAIANSAYLMIQAPLAVYPSWTNSSSGQCSDSSEEYTVGASESYLYTFSRRPPLQSTGFWSLTAYSNNYLIPNDLNRYSLGDRSNLTFADGTSLKGGEDGMFQILIQPADVAPPANWTSNWIPGPTGGGKVQALLRWFGAEQDLLDGTYEYPVVSRQAAITGDSKSGSNVNSTATFTGNGPAAQSPSWILGCMLLAILVHATI